MTAPRRLVWAGERSVAGWWVDARLGQRSVLALWSAGTEVYDGEDGWWVLLAEPVLARPPWPASPLVNVDGLLSACPLATQEREAVSGRLARVVGGELVTAEPRASAAVDPSEWIDLAGLGVEAVRSLGPPPPSLEVEPVVVLDRDRFGVPQADDSVAGLLRELAAPPEQRTGSAEPVAPWWIGLARGLQALGERLSAPRAAIGAGGSGSGADGGTPGLPAEVAPHPPGLLARLGDTLDRWGRQLILRAGLGGLASREQTRFLDALLHELEGGDPLEALRRAVPLGGVAGLESRPWFGTPDRRGNLSPTLQKAGTGGHSASLDGSLYERLRSLYKQTAKRLERAGQIEEAAFVYCDLLNTPELAVAMLERHGRYRLAADIAVGRDLPPERQVRLLWQAGDKRRALAVARRHHAWAQVVAHAESTGLDSLPLRRHWAIDLARAGRMIEAVEVGQPLGAGFVRSWVSGVVARGGVDAAAMRVRALQLGLGGFDEHGPALAELLLGGTDRPDEQRSAVVALAREPHVPLIKGLQRQAVRVVAALPPSADNHRLLDTLLRASGDVALGVDLPPSSTPPDRGTLVHVLAEGQVGLVKVLDAAWLASGHILVALGESGVALLDPDGRRVHHFDVPADKLVVSHNGGRALAVIQRGQAADRRNLLVSIIEVPERRAERWGEVTATYWASAYDGCLWFIADREELLCVDVTERHPRAIWRIEEPGLRGETLRVRPDEVTVCVRGTELWRWTLPSLTLRGRGEVSLPSDRQWWLAPLGRVDWSLGLTELTDTLLSDHPIMELRVQHGQSVSAQIAPQLTLGELNPGLTEPLSDMVLPPSLCLGTDHWCFSQRTPAGVDLVLFQALRQERLSLTLPGCGDCHTRLDGHDVLTVCDARGQVFVFDPVQQRVLADCAARV